MVKKIAKILIFPNSYRLKMWESSRKIQLNTQNTKKTKPNEWAGKEVRLYHHKLGVFTHNDTVTWPLSTKQNPERRQCTKYQLSFLLKMLKSTPLYRIVSWNNCKGESRPLNSTPSISINRVLPVQPGKSQVNDLELKKI